MGYVHGVIRAHGCGVSLFEGASKDQSERIFKVSGSRAESESESAEIQRKIFIALFHACSDRIVR